VRATVASEALPLRAVCPKQPVTTDRFWPIATILRVRFGATLVARLLQASKSASQSGLIAHSNPVVRQMERLKADTATDKSRFGSTHREGAAVPSTNTRTTAPTCPSPWRLASCCRCARTWLRRWPWAATWSAICETKFAVRWVERPLLAHELPAVCVQVACASPSSHEGGGAARWWERERGAGAGRGRRPAPNRWRSRSRVCPMGLRCASLLNGGL